MWYKTQAQGGFCFQWTTTPDPDDRDSFIPTLPSWSVKANIIVSRIALHSSFGAYLHQFHSLVIHKRKCTSAHTYVHLNQRFTPSPKNFLIPKPKIPIYSRKFHDGKKNGLTSSQFEITQPSGPQNLPMTTCGRVSREWSGPWVNCPVWWEGKPKPSRIIDLIWTAYSK